MIRMTDIPDFANAKIPSKDPSIDEFAEIVMTEIRRAHGEGIAQVSYDASAKTLRVDQADGTGHFLELAGFHAMYLQADDLGRSQLVRRRVAIGKTLAKLVDHEESQDSLLPVLRNVMEAIHKRGGIARRFPKMGEAELADLTIVTRPFCEGLDIQLVVDGTETLQFVTAHLANTWDASHGDLFDRALVNLRERMKARPVKWSRSPEGFYAASGEYACSCLLAPESLGDLQVAGRLVALAATRDDLFIAGEGDAGALRAMLARGLAALQRDQSIHICAADLLVLDDGTWKPFEPQRLDVLAEAANFRARVRAEEYALQEREWKQRKGASDGPPYLSPCQLGQNPDGDLMTGTVWVNGVPALIPEAMMVILAEVPVAGRAPQPPVAAHFGDLLRLAGDCMVKQDGYPPRYLVAAHPPAAVIAELRGARAPNSEPPRPR